MQENLKLKQEINAQQTRQLQALQNFERLRGENAYMRKCFEHFRDDMNDIISY